jgi:hypothetical protein
MIALTRKTLLATPMLFISVETHALEAELYNSYWTDSAKTRVNSLTCGSTPGSSGCYGSATLGPFHQVCAMVATEVAKKTEQDGSTTFKRRVAIMDRGKLAGVQVRFYIYLETQTVTAAGATTQTSRVRTLTLPLVGGPSASCFMARNASGFYVGTDKSPSAVRVSNTTFEITTLGSFSPPIPVASITAMQDGHVAVTHKGASSSGATIYGNDGKYEMGGGLELFLAGTQNASTIAGAQSCSASVSTAAASTALVDAQTHIVARDEKSVLRDSAGAIVLDSAQVIHFH